MTTPGATFMPPSADIRPLSIPRRTIGAILVDSGRLSTEDAEQVFHKQRESGLRFGEAALRLGLVTEEDIRYALARQFDFPSLGAADESLSRELVAAYQPYSRAVEQLRVLRSQLMLRWFDNDHERRPLAIVAPTHGSGASFITANLAIVFAQLGERTLLIDANLRMPRQDRLFKIPPGPALAEALSGHAVADPIVRVAALPNLAVLPAGSVPPNPQELLGRPQFAEILARASRDYGVVLIDTPAAGEYADAQIVAARAGAAVLVARRNVTSVPEMAQVARQVQNVGALLLGTVLNDGS